MQNEDRSWVVVAHLLRPQGRKGELLAELLTDFPQRFTERPNVFLAPPDFNGTEAEAQRVAVSSSWLPVGRNKGKIVLHFAGVDSISAGKAIAGLDVIVPLEDRIPLDEESVYISDLAGCTLYDKGTIIGVVEHVQFAMTADGSSRIEDAAPLLEVNSGQGEHVLIPFARTMIRGIDIGQKRIDMDLPNGLLEVNRVSHQGPKTESQSRSIESDKHGPS